MSEPRFVLTPARFAGLAAGVVALVALSLADTPLRAHPGFGARPAYAAGATALMAIWWLTEAIPIHWTALVPLALFPAFGVFGPGLGRNVAATAAPYAHSYIFLFGGGMCIAAAMQQWDLHRRIALAIMSAVGAGPQRLLFGLLAATAFVSVWISNTATAAMMLPIGLALISQLEAQSGGRRLEHFGGALMLAIAYGANVGGIGSKIGTAPNAQLCGFLAQEGVEVSFLQFSAIGAPFVLLFLPIAWLALWRLGRRDAPAADVGASALAGERAKLGPMKRGEKIALGAFLAAAALWIAGTWITDFLEPRVTLFRVTSADVEGGVAVLAALVLLAWPVDGRRALDLRTLRTIPWSTLLLLGGSFSMAEGVKQSGLSQLMADRLAGLRDLSPFAQVLAASGATVALSAIASNTATVAVMLNVLKGSVSPAHLSTVIFTSGLAASCDFALPAGTPPNAIVFASGYVTIPRMVKVGVLLDVAAAVIMAAWCSLAVPRVL